MARARNIKPGFFRNAELVELGFDRRLLFAGLWTLADRDGLLEDRPKQIKMEIFPADNVDVDKALADLHASELILRYEVDGKRYIQVLKFHKHQHPHHKEPPSTIPKPGASPPLHERKAPDCLGIHKEESLGQTQGNTEANPADVLIPDVPDVPDSGLLNPDSRPNPKPSPQKRGSRSGNGENKFEIPPWVPREQWDAWIEARKKKKKDPTVFAKELAVAKLEELRDLGHHPAAVLAQSAFHGWTDLYPPKA